MVKNNKGVIMVKSTNKSKQRRNEILQASQELFNKKGFHDTSINDIMKKVGAAKGVFYYYFETKDQILDTLIGQHIANIVETVEAALDKPGLNALEKLRCVLEEEFRLSMANYNPDNHIHNIKNVDMHQRILVGMVEKFSPVISELVKQGINEGLFKTDYPLEVSQIIVAGVHFVTDLGIFKWSGEEYTKRIKASEELIEKALCIKQGSFAFLSELLGDTPDRIIKNVK
jgi:AcrR family transcriptional regulator